MRLPFKDFLCRISFPANPESRVLFGLTLPPAVVYISAGGFFYLMAFEGGVHGIGRWIWLIGSAFLMAFAVLAAVMLLLRAAASGGANAPGKIAVRSAALGAGAVFAYVMIELIGAWLGIDRFRYLAIMLFLPTALSAMVLPVEAWRRRCGIGWALSGSVILPAGAAALRWYGRSLTMEETVAGLLAMFFCWYLFSARGWYLLSGMRFRNFFAPAGGVWAVLLLALIVNLFAASIENLRVREAYRRLEARFGVGISASGLADAYYGDAGRAGAIDATDGKFRIDVDPDSGWWNFSSRLARSGFVPDWRRISEWRRRDAAAIAELDALAYRAVRFDRPETLVFDAGGGAPGDDSELLVRAARLNYLLFNQALATGDSREAVRRFYALGGLLRSAGADVFAAAADRSAEIAMLRLAELEQLIERRVLPEKLLCRLLDNELTVAEPETWRRRIGLGDAVIVRGTIGQLLVGGFDSKRGSLVSLKQLGAFFPPVVFLIRHVELGICARIESGATTGDRLERSVLHEVIPRGSGIDTLLRLPAAIELARCGVAAEIFRIRNGRMPESIAELTPEYLKTIPRDPANGVPAELNRGPQVIELIYPRAYPGEWGADHFARVLLTAPGWRFFFPGRESERFVILPPSL